MDISLFIWLLWKMLPWTRVYKYLLESLLSILLCIDKKVELSDHVIVLCLNLWGTPYCFSQHLHHFSNSFKRGFQISLNMIKMMNESALKLNSQLTNKPPFRLVCKQCSQQHIRSLLLLVTSICFCFKDSDMLSSLFRKFLIF